MVRYGLFTCLFAVASVFAQPGPVTVVPGGGSYFAAVTAVLTCPTSGATIRYTTNGATPAVTDAGVASGGSILVDHSLQLRAAAFLSGVSGAVTAADYLVQGKLASGYNNSFAVFADGSLRGWGGNGYGQLGLGAGGDRSFPVLINTVTNVADIG